ncbi:MULTISPECIES: hypothetical protein [unclassified Neisseria]|uniref:hypothetical protein n=1 Tax=unclassified Neisseria TaxID=2623750 RepID=UPI002666C5FB|nr:MULTISPECIES: hypothetical protein [unclassified Neisseria]MDO1510662.1 hypothetical protein [Neisseria sp. MVDL19-042950]MDO1516952.1 hypothetical protein [Neisseria sp. MVDL18-041461]MDO1564314.1 hypothetical protein [Neisseria sp. MVDL20-010259]
MKKLTKFLLFILIIIPLTILISLFRFSITSGNGGVGSLGLIVIIPLESFGMSVVLTLLAFLIVPKLPRINNTLSRKKI